MTRKEELIALLKDNAVLYNLIDDVIFLEEQLVNLRKLPFIKVHPDQPDLQKPTPAAKQYKELLQQYNNCVKTICSVLHKDNTEDGDTPLRAYFKRFE